MAAHFECYLVDEITGVGDARFRAKCHQVFRDRLSSSQVIMVSHSEQTLRSYCQSALLLDQGEATLYEDISEALEIYNRSKAA
jgi:capsular polysaccharide transport system ATP-binding protein